MGENGASSGIPAETGGWMAHISGFCITDDAEVVGLGNLRNFFVRRIAQERASWRASAVVSQGILRASGPTGLEARFFVGLGRVSGGREGREVRE